MYQSHFGLTHKPFGASPDPRYFYQGTSHSKALSSLIDGIHERCGLMSLVGDVGTGKSMLINALREVLPVSLRTILIAHTTVNRDDLLELILRELKLEDATMHPAPDLVQDNDFYYVGYNRTSPPTRAGRLYRLKEFVMSEHNAKRPPPLLIVDEAQNLSEEVLEEIRLLTNLELPQCKLLASRGEQRGLSPARYCVAGPARRRRVRRTLLSWLSTRQYAIFFLRITGRTRVQKHKRP